MRKNYNNLFELYSYTEKMSQNLYQIQKYSDLVDFLKGGKDKFIILTLIDDNTDTNIRNMLKKYIKDKSKKFTNVLFLYYVVKPEDAGRVHIGKEDLTKSTPKMLHIYDVHTLLIGISQIDSVEDVEHTFGQVEKYYLDDLAENMESVSDKNQSSQEIKSDKNQSSPELKSDKKEFVQLDPLVEKKKMLDKIVLLRDRVEKFNRDFLNDIMLRKKEEEKI